MLAWYKANYPQQLPTGGWPSLITARKNEDSTGEGFFVQRLTRLKAAPYHAAFCHASAEIITENTYSVL